LRVITGEAILGPAMPASANLADLGRRVRIARLARRMTLEEVVSQTEFTVSWLSKLENGQLAPSLEGLVRLADVLQCGVDALVAGLSIPPQFVVVRNGEGRERRGKGSRGMTVECLADSWRNRSMDPVILHLSGTGPRARPNNHDGERFLMVLEGEVRVGYGEEQILLATGDSLYLHAAIPHTIVPAGRASARVLSVAYEKSPSPSAGSDGRAVRTR